MFTAPNGCKSSLILTDSIASSDNSSIKKENPPVLLQFAYERQYNGRNEYQYTLMDRILYWAEKYKRWQVNIFSNKYEMTYMIFTPLTLNFFIMLFKLSFRYQLFAKSKRLGNIQIYITRVALRIALKIVDLLGRFGNHHALHILTET